MQATVESHPSSPISTELVVAPPRSRSAAGASSASNSTQPANWARGPANHTVNATSSRSARACAMSVRASDVAKPGLEHRLGHEAAGRLCLPPRIREPRGIAGARRRRVGPAHTVRGTHERLSNSSRRSPARCACVAASPPCRLRRAEMRPAKVHEPEERPGVREPALVPHLLERGDRLRRRRFGLPRPPFRVLTTSPSRDLGQGRAPGDASLPSRARTPWPRRGLPPTRQNRRSQGMRTRAGAEGRAGRGRAPRAGAWPSTAG